MSTFRAPLRLLLGLAFCAVLPAQQPASGVIGRYNGEWQSGVPGAANWCAGPDVFYRVYDEFEVPAPGWTVIAVFGDNALRDFAPVTTAVWEIHRNMAPGKGGKVVASGLSPAVQLPDPSVTASRYPASEAEKHYRIQVEGLWTHPERPGTALFQVAHGPAFVAAETPASAVKSAVGRHFVQGVMSAR
jgi:hypothetical protein